MLARYNSIMPTVNKRGQEGEDIARHYVQDTLQDITIHYEGLAVSYRVKMWLNWD